MAARTLIRSLLVGVISLLCASCLPLSHAVEEPDGYRVDRYDDEVPETLKGAIRVTAVDAAKLQSEQGALIVDVIPEHIKPDALPAEQLWFPVDHVGIAGALWLPDVGYGMLSDTTEDYFINHLVTATQANLDHPVIFYCRSDCWMSWNAAKRALGLGYTQIYWFADGIEDWQFEDLDTEVLTPAPGARH